MSVEGLRPARTPGVDPPGAATRASLLKRLRTAGDELSWRTFFEAYWRLIYNIARKTGLTDADAQDVVQETVIAVARRMPDYRYDPGKGSFRQWLLVITRRRIQDHLRRAYRSKRRTSYGMEEEMAEIPSPEQAPDERIEAAWRQEWQSTVLEQALVRVRQRVNPRHYQVFEVCVLRAMPASDAARMFGLSAAKVYLVKHRVAIALKQAVREIERELSSAAD